MKLTLAERIGLQKLLPQEGNFVTLKILNSLRMSLAPSEEEHKEFEINVKELEINVGDSPSGLQRITWGEKGFEEREIEIGEKATEIIVEVLKKLDESKKLTNEHFSIYEKFVK